MNHISLASMFGSLPTTPKSWFFTYSTTIEPSKLFLDPLTTESVFIHSIAFLTGYKLVGITTLGFLVKFFRRAKVRQITVFTYFTTIDRPKIPLHQVYHHLFDSIFHGLQFGMHHCPLIIGPNFF